MNRLSFLLASGVLLFAAGTAQAAEITVSAAASLTNALTEVKSAFEAAHKGVTINTNFAASNPLLQQIREGAPADVFASADQDTMNKAEAAKLIDPATRRNFVTNTLVLIVPADGKSPVKSVKDLTQAKTIAVGNPDSVPAGRYVKASLTALGQWDALSPKFVLGETVRQVLDYVSRSEADAGFVYATDASIAKDKVRVVATMLGHEPILYPIAIVATSSSKVDAQAFVDYLLSAEGMRILESYGFSPAE